MLLYTDRFEIIKGIKILPKKINVISLDSEYKYPNFVLLNPDDNAYMTQNLSKLSYELLENLNLVKNF
jgi:hypothetical protein